MFGADPYLAERSMDLRVRAARDEAQRVGAWSFSASACRLACRVSPLMVKVGGRLVRPGLPPYPVDAKGKAGQDTWRGGGRLDPVPGRYHGCRCAMVSPGAPVSDSVEEYGVAMEEKSTNWTMKDRQALEKFESVPGGHILSAL